jgi:hypothetical protein
MISADNPWSEIYLVQESQERAEENLEKEFSNSKDLLAVMPETFRNGLHSRSVWKGMRSLVSSFGNTQDWEVYANRDRYDNLEARANQSQSESWAFLSDK